MNHAEQSRRSFLKVVTAAGAAAAAIGGQTAQAGLFGSKGKSVMGLKHAPLQKVRVGFIGTGARGSGHVASMLKIEGAEVVAICDTHEPSRKRSIDRVQKETGKAPAGYGEKGDEHYLEMLKREDLDMVIIATPWEWHARMCIDAMKAGKHAFTEVPMGITTEELWEIVNVSEATQKHCMMLENVNYGREELFCLNIVRQGLIGELLHGEAAYIHELRGQMNEVEHGTGSWRTYHYAKRNGNLYPTHGLGPVAQYMNICRGDRFDYMSAVASPAMGRALWAKAKFPPNHKWNQIKQWNCGDIVTSIVKTIKGRSIMVQWDETSPRPYTRLNLIQGTKGTFASFPNRFACEGITGSTHEWTEESKLEEIMKKYEHPLWAKMGELAKKNGGHGGMDFIMLWRIIYCLRNGEPLDQNVYEGASWSVIGPLSEKSIANRSQSLDVPDFTRGAWETGAPLGIVS
jgi:predicted dehydrogenase